MTDLAINFTATTHNQWDNKIFSPATGGCYAVANRTGLCACVTGTSGNSVAKLNDDSQEYCSAHSISAASAVGKHDDNKVFSEISEILFSFVCWMCERENKPGYM